MRSRKSWVERTLARRKHFRLKIENQISTWLSHEPCAGNQCRVTGGRWAAHQSNTAFLMIARIVHNQMPTAIGVTGAQCAQEVANLQIGMPLVALGEDLPGPHIKGGKEIDRAMADILKFLAFDQARAQGQRGVQALQGLDVGLLIKTENPTVGRGMQIEIENLGHLLLEQRVRAGQEVAQAMGLEHQRCQNSLNRSRTHGQNFSASGDQLRQIPHAVVRKAPKLTLLNALAGDGDDRVPRQRGKKPAGDPTGASPPARPSVLSDRLLPPPSAAAVHTGQSVCAISAPNCARSRFGLQSPDWALPRAPAGEWSPAAPSVAVFCPPAARLPTPAVRQHSGESHNGAEAYAPRNGGRCLQYTANELARHGTRNMST